MTKKAKYLNKRIKGVNTMKRIAIIIITIMMIISICLAIKIFVGKYQFPTEEYRISCYTVQSGDTLAGIAARYAPNLDWRIYADAVRELNGISSCLIAGDTIYIYVSR